MLLYHDDDSKPESVKCSADYLLQPSECSGDLCQGCIILHPGVRGTGSTPVIHQCSYHCLSGKRQMTTSLISVTSSEMLSEIADHYLMAGAPGQAQPCTICVKWLVLRSGQAITLRNTATTHITTLSLGAINQTSTASCIVHSNKIKRH